MKVYRVDLKLKPLTIHVTVRGKGVKGAPSERPVGFLVRWAMLLERTVYCGSVPLQRVPTSAVA